MKKFLWILSSALLLSTAILSTGCGEDENPKLSPVVIVTSGPEPSTVEEGAGTIAYVTVEARQGTDPLKAFTVYEGDTKIEIDHLTIDGDPAPSATVAIINPTEVMTWEIGVHVHADAGLVTYKIVVEDDGGLSDEVSFDVTVEAQTPLDATITGVLWNQAGQTGHGTLDLDEGKTAGVLSNGDTTPDQAEIRDCGIDSTSSIVSDWRKQITYFNGTELRYLGNSLPDYDFDNIDSKEDILKAYNDATAVNGSPINEDGSNTWGSYSSSDVVEVGDIFVVKKSSPERYYIFIIDKINEIPGALENEDNYELSIKY